MRALVYERHCPGCGKRVHGPSKAAIELRLVRHVRNCNVLRPMLARAQAQAVLDGAPAIVAVDE